jgi:hypothetical protein
MSEEAYSQISPDSTGMSTPNVPAERSLNFSHIQDSKGRLIDQEMADGRSNDPIDEGAAKAEDQARNELKRFEEALPDEETQKDIKGRMVRIEERISAGDNNEALRRQLEGYQEQLDRISQGRMARQKEVSMAGAKYIGDELLGKPWERNPEIDKIVDESEYYSFVGYGTGLEHLEFTESIESELEQSENALREQGFYGIELESELFSLGCELLYEKIFKQAKEALLAASLSEDVASYMAGEIASQKKGVALGHRAETIINKIGALRESGESIASYLVEAIDPTLSEELRTFQGMRDTIVKRDDVIGVSGYFSTIWPQRESDSLFDGLKTRLVVSSLAAKAIQQAESEAEKAGGSALTDDQKRAITTRVYQAVEDLRGRNGGFVNKMAAATE